MNLPHGQSRPTRVGYSEVVAATFLSWPVPAHGGKRQRTLRYYTETGSKGAGETRPSTGAISGAPTRIGAIDLHRVSGVLFSKTKDVLQRNRMRWT